VDQLPHPGNTADARRKAEPSGAGPSHEWRPRSVGRLAAAGNLPSQGSGDLPLNPLLARFGTNSKGDLPYRPETRERMSKRRMKDQHYLTCITPGGM